MRWRPRKNLGDGTRVVSMPCMERFNRESEEYREEVLPKHVGNVSRSKPASPKSGINTSASTGK